MWAQLFNVSLIGKDIQTLIYSPGSKSTFSIKIQQIIIHRNLPCWKGFVLGHMMHTERQGQFHIQHLCQCQVRTAVKRGSRLPVRPRSASNPSSRAAVTAACWTLKLWTTPANCDNGPTYVEVVHQKDDDDSRHQPHVELAHDMVLCSRLFVFF